MQAQRISNLGFTINKQKRAAEISAARFITKNKLLLFYPLSFQSNHRYTDFFNQTVCLFTHFRRKFIIFQNRIKSFQSVRFFCNFDNVQNRFADIYILVFLHCFEHTFRFVGF